MTETGIPTRSDRRALHGLILANLAVEAVLLGADHGLWGSTLGRGLAYEYGGFWAGLLHNWQPNYSLQPVAMFFTYSLLHAGISHVAGNMLSLIFLGEPVVARIGSRGFLLLYLLASLGGALCFGLFTRSPAPMIGASGAIFGLAGALTVWDAQDRRARGLRGRVWLIVLGLIFLNLVFWWSAAGNLAWQTHLGGFLTGAALARYAPGFLIRKIRS